MNDLMFLLLYYNEEECGERRGEEDKKGYSNSTACITDVTAVCSRATIELIQYQCLALFRVTTSDQIVLYFLTPYPSTRSLLFFNIDGYQLYV